MYDANRFGVATLVFYRLAYYLYQHEQRSIGQRVFIVDPLVLIREGRIRSTHSKFLTSISA